MTATRGFGLAGESPDDAIQIAAMSAENAGYDSFWLSQPREGSSLAKLGSMAGTTRAIRLGVGAIPLTSLSAEEIDASVCDLSLPLERLRLGIGSGTGRGSLDRLRHGVQALRSLLDVEIVVAPLGPKMCRLAGELADTVLLNWLTPSYAATSAGWIREGAETAGRNQPVTATYLRCAIGTASRERLVQECARYGSFPHYAAHFQRQGVEPIATTILAHAPEEMQERLAEYEDILDHVVVRAITAHDTPDEMMELVGWATPSL